MLFLFVLILFSSCSFSLYLFLSGFVLNPLVYVLLGWGTVVAAHYITFLFDAIKLNILNRNFQAFLVNGDGEFWDGESFTSGKNGTEPEFTYNELQVNKMVKHVIHVTGNNDLYLRIMPQIEFEELE